MAAAPPQTGSVPPDSGGDDSGEGGDADADEDGEAEDDGQDAPDDTASDHGLSKLATDFDLEGWLRRGIHFADRDGDGITDAVDPLPDAPPTLADPDSVSAPLIDGAWSDIDGRRVANVALEGYPLQLAVRGITGNEGSLWIAFRTASGLRARRARVAGEGLLEVAPEPGARGIHLIAGSSRSLNFPLHSLRLDEPVLFPPEGPVAAGGELRLAGLNLDRVERLKLSGRIFPYANNPTRCWSRNCRRPPRAIASPHSRRSGCRTESRWIWYRR